MRQEIANKWADALESGEYTQGAFSLAVEDTAGRATHCCLGVLCVLAIADGVDVPKTGERYSDDHVDGVMYGYGVEQAEALLPYEAMKWAGMQSNDGTCPNAGEVLASLNDFGVPFYRIAEIIRENADTL